MRTLNVLGAVAALVVTVSFASYPATAKSRHHSAGAESLVCQGSVVGSVSFRHDRHGYSAYSYDGQPYPVHSHAGGFAIGNAGAFMHVDGPLADGQQVTLRYDKNGQGATGSANCSKMG